MPQSNNPKLSIITPVHNQAGHTFRYLSSHWAYMSAHSHIEWIIVDNGSTDTTASYLEQYKQLLNSRLKIITNPANLGFGEANNQAVEAAKGDYLLFLNNDIQIMGDYTPTIIKALDNDPSKLYGPELLTYDTGWNKFGDILIEYIAAWCLAMSKDVFLALGGFDPIYSPAYYEDMDLCYAAQKAGFALKKIDVGIFHISGQTGMHLPKQNELTLRNKARFAKKWRLAHETT